MQGAGNLPEAQQNQNINLQLNYIIQGLPPPAPQLRKRFRKAGGMFSSICIWQKSPWNTFIQGKRNSITLQDSRAVKMRQDQLRWVNRVTLLIYSSFTMLIPMDEQTSSSPMLQWILMSEIRVSECLPLGFWRAAWIQLSLLGCTTFLSASTPACLGFSGWQPQHQTYWLATLTREPFTASFRSLVMMLNRTGHRTDLQDSTHNQLLGRRCMTQ